VFSRYRPLLAANGARQELEVRTTASDKKPQNRNENALFRSSPLRFLSYTSIQQIKSRLGTTFA
jgi:hypothetical protein